VQFSTGGRSGAGKERGGMLPLRPDMASLSVGSNNFPTRVYENPPDLVDWLAGEMIRLRREAGGRGLRPVAHLPGARDVGTGGSCAAYVQFVMGVKNAMPADRPVFDFYVATVKRLFGADAQWCAAGIGPNQIVLNEWCVAAGGHAARGWRTTCGSTATRLAPSNAALVRRVVDLCDRYERPVATWAQARSSKARWPRCRESLG
jgi:3-keto-5-aminohexanoate cleavage enzyme